MIITLGVLGLSFRISNPSGQLAWIAVICLMGYVASFAISLGPIFWLLIAEIYPLRNSRARRRHGGHVQLGLEPDRFAYFPDVGRETTVRARHSCSTRLPRWRRGSLPIILFQKRRGELWKRSKHSGEQGIMFAKRASEFPNSIVRDYAVSRGQALDQ